MSGQLKTTSTKKRKKAPTEKSNTPKKPREKSPTRKETHISVSDSEGQANETVGDNDVVFEDETGANETREIVLPLDIEPKQEKADPYAGMFSDDEDDVPLPDVHVNDEVTFDEVMTGTVMRIDGEKAILHVKPTHNAGMPLTPEEVSAYTDGGETMEVMLSRAKLVVREAIKKVPAEGVDITHFNPGPVTASEHIVAPGNGPVGPTNTIVITNHGLGSGVYGVANVTPEHTEAAQKYDGSMPNTIHMANPLYLQDKEHGDQLTSLSKDLQRLAEKYRLGKDQSKDTSDLAAWLLAQEEVTDLAKKLVVVAGRAGNDLTEDAAAAAVRQSLNAFLTAYYTSTTSVAQPLNFLLQGQLGYDGIYAPDDYNNSFTRGNVSFNVPSTMPRTTRADRVK